MKLIFYDFEVLKNDWFVSFYKEDTNEWFSFRNNRSGLLAFILKHKPIYYFVGYNSSVFDDICLKCIWYGINPYVVIDHCINQNKPYWTIPALQFKKNIPGFVSIDLMTLPKTLNLSLKEIEGNLGLDIIECDLTNKDRLTNEEYEEALKYNKHDVYSTYTLYQQIKEEVEAKDELIKEYKLSHKFYNKTIPAIGKEILKAKIIPQENQFTYTCPKCITIENKEILDVFNNKTFEMKSLLSKEFCIKSILITLALGGIHGAKENYIFNINKDNVVYHVDVASLYPNLMYNDKNREFNFLSRAMQDPESYKELKIKRLKYKSSGNKKKDWPLKVVINSLYGLSGYTKNGKPTTFTDWVNARKTCITGQLALFMLLEQCNKISSFNCFNLNTDGIITTINKNDLDNINNICDDWCNKLGLELEKECITKGKIIQKDVNNYIIYNGDKNKLEVKGKDVNKYNGGTYYNNTASIIDEAIVKYFVYNKPINETIQEAYDKNEAIKFQIVLARKSKNYTATYYGDKIVQKVNRVFPTYDTTKPPLTKLKNGTKCLFADAPEHAILANQSVKNINLKEINLDLNYYFNIINKKIDQWKGEK